MNWMKRILPARAKHPDGFLEAMKKALKRLLVRNLGLLLSPRFLLRPTFQPLSAVSILFSFHFSFVWSTWSRNVWLCDQTIGDELFLNPRQEWRRSILREGDARAIRTKANPMRLGIPYTLDSLIILHSMVIGTSRAREIKRIATISPGT